MSKRSTVKGPTFGGDDSKTFSYGSIEPVSSSTDRDHSQISNSSKVELRRFSATSATSDALPDPLAYLDLPDSVLPATRERRSATIDEFNNEGAGPPDLKKLANLAKALRTGRQRKKTAARTKGGEFQARRKKRRVYFCCISNDIDVERLADEFQSAHFGMKGQMYDEVLHLYLASSEDAAQAAAVDKLALNRQYSEESVEMGLSPPSPAQLPKTASNSMFGIAIREPAQLSRPHSSNFEVSYKEDTLRNDPENDGGGADRSPSGLSGLNGSISLGMGLGGHRVGRLNSFEDDGYFSSTNQDLDMELIDGESSPLHTKQSGRDLSETDHNPLRDTPPLFRELSSPSHHDQMELLLLQHGQVGQGGEGAFSGPSHTEHSKEVFVFGFGAAVYWGLAKSEVQDLLQFIETFIVKEPLSKEEFEAGEDDMAFVTDYTQSSISIANDVITLPPLTSVKERLAVSFAIAQSAVLTIFEARVEKKTEEYKYIPETLALSGKVNLSPKQLGTMIGEVFVMQHDVNLHSEILDLPDYFWREHAVEPLYRMTMGYMEMVPRISVLNKRLDLLRQLLRVLQQQHENAHSVKLEWIVIWLIVMSCVLEMWDIIKDVFGIELHGEGSLA